MLAVAQNGTSGAPGKGLSNAVSNLAFGRWPRHDRAELGVHGIVTYRMGGGIVRTGRA